MLQFNAYDYTDEFDSYLLEKIIEFSPYVEWVREHQGNHLYRLQKKNVKSLIEELEMIYRRFMEWSYHSNVNVKVFKDLHNLKRELEFIHADNWFKDEDEAARFVVERRTRKSSYP